MQTNWHTKNARIFTRKQPPFAAAARERRTLPPAPGWPRARGGSAYPRPGGGARLALAVLSALFLAGLSPAHAQDRPAAANLDVVQVDWENTTNSVVVTSTLSLNRLGVREGSTRGDFNVQVGESAADDYLGGAWLSSVSQNGRDSYLTNNYAVSSVHVAADGCRVCAFVPTAPQAGSAAEFNVNVAVAWFPYDEYLAGTARNSTGANGGTNDLFIGSPGLELGTHFRGVDAGKSVVDLRSRGIDARTDGILLVGHAKDENNFALSQVNPNDGTWNVFVRDNAQYYYTNYEQDPVAFVFIPKTNTTLISGRFNGDGSLAAFSGDTPPFTVTNFSTGQWELKIPGHTPAGGVLILSAEGGGTYNGDNIVSYQANAAGDGWVIQSRDTPNNGLQTPVGPGGAPEAVASFVFIPAPVTTRVAPDPQAQNPGVSPLLQVAVPETLAGDLRVTFYGREAPTPPVGPDFCIVVMPDTQNYAAQRNGGTKEMMIAQTEWAINNRTTRNVAYVAQLGDIVNNGDTPSYVSQWYNATNAMYRLENRPRTQLPDGMAYGVAVGNHEQSPNGDAVSGTTSNYNRFFGVAHFAGREYYAGHYGTNNNNHYDFFSASGLDFVVLYFEYNTSPSAEVLAWGNAVLANHPHRRAIVITHYMGSAATPSSFSAQGSAIYNALKTNANLFLLLGGHVCGSTGEGEGSRTDTYKGNIVRTLISDYQCRTNGGNGWMRIMDFSPSNNVVTVQTYSPWTGEYETDENSEFFFPYNMHAGASGSPGTPYAVLGANTGVSPGSVTSFRWSGLQSHTAYDWYVVVTDGRGNTIEQPAWSFTTGFNVAPEVSNQLLTVVGDAPAPVALPASDPNGDALTFQLNSLPIRGRILNLDTNAGTLTYLPARGFRGTDFFTFQASDGALSSSVASLTLKVVAPPDANSNNLPDAWEAAYGVSDPHADDDGDGATNLQEYWAGTNPTNAASVFQITDWQRLPNGHFHFTWPSIGGVRYRVQFRNGTALSGAAGAFTDIVRLLTNEMDPSPCGTVSTQSFTDDFSLTGSAPPGGARYYRVRLVQ
ncbi:MAG TPA: Ig-like domain-containing protein [Candidatus Paceibacterota bacterium]|nr:Ig-like domain-containing protein [Verrucomicrobiota bacterium]HRY58553.1 Ig-like domain-containing protein [Candidatus Paceibacterota bacterium]HRZ68535.1 Ig-like domain-containing protein [Candidatus Paceibacterota bacterium]